MSTFSENLKNQRAAKGLTQKEVAEALNISATGYAGYEQGYREPDFKTLIAMCKLLEISADYLLGLEDEAGAKSF